jgi:tRNA(Arg) A34 adenosine deaminase TadA
MDHVEAMRAALKEAALAQEAGDVPVGAVVVFDDHIVSRAHNEREHRNDPTAHAELLAIAEAASVLGRSSLEGCTLVVSLEPCVMCAGGILSARLERLVFAAFDPKAGACGSRYNLLSDPRLGLEIPVTADVLGDEAAAQLKAFFATRRGDRNGVEVC